MEFLLEFFEREKKQLLMIHPKNRIIMTESGGKKIINYYGGHTHTHTQNPLKHRIMSE